MSAPRREQTAERQCVAGEPYLLTHDLIEQTRAYTPGRPCTDLHAPTTLLLDLGNEVIDTRAAAALYRGCARVLAFPGGDHGFRHLEQVLGLIREAAAPASAEAQAIA